MPDSTITAAWIQAAGTFVPTAALALAAIYGLFTWRTQLLEQRRIERAETCLVAADDVMKAVRSSRGTVFLTQDEVEAAGSLDKATSEYEWREFQRALDAFEVFHQAYRRASFFIEMPTQDTDREFGDCLNKLEIALRQVRFWEKHAEASVQHARRQVAKFRGEFLGLPSEDIDPSKPTPPDPIALRLSTAMVALEDKLLPVTGGKRKPRQ